MIQTSIQFNGSVTVTLKPTNEEEKQLLGLAFNGKTVTAIQPGPDGSMVLTLKVSEGK